MRGGIITEKCKEAEKRVKNFIKRAKRIEKKLAIGYRGTRDCSTPLSNRVQRVDYQSYLLRLRRNNSQLHFGNGGHAELGL